VTKVSAQLDAGLYTTKGGEESYDLSGHLNMPVTDNIAVRAVGFYSREGGYVDNVLGTTLMGDQDNADVVEEDQNDYSAWGGRIAARWQISPEWESTLSRDRSVQRSRWRLGVGPGARRLQDHALLRRVSRMTAGGRVAERQG
jgi:hypothetical protein